MWSFVALFVLACVNPFGGMFVAIPIAIFKLDWPAWLAVLLSVPLAYMQVATVDLMWERLQAWPWWVGMIEKRQSPRLSALLARDDAKLWLALLGVWAGPWLVTAVARYSGHKVGRVALPLLFGITYVAVGTALACTYAPHLLPK
ncbi:MAG TPA: hypothetical protein VI299_20610 [Polyangiales bacterium]